MTALGQPYAPEAAAAPARAPAAAPTAATAGATAPEDLLDAVGISSDRLSTLHALFDQAGTQATESLRRIAPSPIFFLLSEVVSTRIGDVLSGLEGQHVAAAFHAPDWNARLLIAADAAFVHSALEALLGADGSVSLTEAGRPFSKIEMRLAATVFDHVARALHGSFVTGGPAGGETPLKMEKIDTMLSPALIGRKRDLAVVARFGIWTLERGGEMIVAVPRAAVHRLGANRRRHERAPHDPRWTMQMQREVRRTEVTLDAVLDETELTLGGLSQLAPGQVLRLQATPRTPVRLVCDGQTLFRAELGQAHGSYTLRLQDASDDEQDAMDQLLAR